MKSQIFCYRLLGFLAFFAGPSAVAAHWPSRIECVPEVFYSGGFDFYQIANLDPGSEAPQFEGRRFFQGTTPHGIKTGKPLLTAVVSLITSRVGRGSIQVFGFENSMGQVDTLLLPEAWTGEAIRLDSELFHNDLISDGICREI
jgi:hypothetical protein